MRRPLAYITAPWGDNEFENTETAARYCRMLYDAGYSPVCPLLFLPLFLKDEIPQEHKDGIDIAHEERYCRCRAAADHGHYPGGPAHRKRPGPREGRQP